MKNIIRLFVKTKKIIFLVLIIIFLVGFIFGNVLFMVDQDSSPKFIQKIIVSESELSQKIMGNGIYESEVYARSGSSCGG